MEMHIMEIVRFALYMATISVSLVFMIKADDNNFMRRFSLGGGVLLVYFNEQIGNTIYLVMGSTLETLIAAMGVLFVLILAAIITIFPLIALFRWTIH
ncbi:MAG: hypothetical protein Q4E24_01295 [bacterium]|nr:hypothetical protein [bacterium]